MRFRIPLRRRSTAKKDCGGALADTAAFVIHFRPSWRKAMTNMATELVGVNGHTPHISGRGIRRRRLSRSQRVRLAAGLVRGEVRLDLSMAQVCDLLSVPAADLRTELKARTVKTTVAALVEAWRGASEEERTAAIREIGVARVWDVLASTVA
jgi:hypothetical protein